jgi:hypothetical protein
MTRALAAWGASAPDWILALAKACDLASQSQVAALLEISAPRVNQVLGRSYKGRMDRVEQLVRGQYMKATVTCPVLGEISTRDCQEHQLRLKNFRPTNPLRIELRAACPNCPNREKECTS